MIACTGVILRCVQMTKRRKRTTTATLICWAGTAIPGSLAPRRRSVFISNACAGISNCCGKNDREPSRPLYQQRGVPAKLRHRHSHVRQASKNGSWTLRFDDEANTKKTKVEIVAAVNSGRCISVRRTLTRCFLHFVACLSYVFLLGRQKNGGGDQGR